MILLLQQVLSLLQQSNDGSSLNAAELEFNRSPFRSCGIRWYIDDRHFRQRNSDGTWPGLNNECARSRSKATCVRGERLSTGFGVESSWLSTTPSIHDNGSSVCLSVCSSQGHSRDSMLGLDPATRGFEPCSTSYARDSGRRTAWRCACAASGRRAGRCNWKQSQTRRTLLVVAVKVDSSEPDPTLYTVEQYKTQPNKLVKGPAGDLGLTRRHITLKDAETGRWADDFEEQDDWRSLWEEGGLVYDDPEKLDDTYDALNWGTYLL